MKRAIALFVTALAACARPAAPPPQAPPVVAVPAPIRAEEPKPALRETPDAEFRRAPPPLGPLPHFTPPAVRPFKLRNGVSVLFVEDHVAPLIALGVVAPLSGAKQRPGARALMAAALPLGTAAHPESGALRRAFDDAGAELDTWAPPFGTLVTLSTLPDDAATAIGLVGEAVQKATFPAAFVDHERVAQISDVESDDSQPFVSAHTILRAALLGADSALVPPIKGSVRDLRAVTRDEVVRAYEQELDPRAVTVVVAGNITQQALTPILESAFGGWKAKGPRAKATASHAPSAGHARIVLVDRPRAPQALVLAGGTAAGPRSRDWAALDLLDDLAGAGDTGRIGRLLRERGLSSEVRSGLELIGRDTAEIWWQAQVDASRASDTLRAIDAEIRSLCDAEIAGDVLAEARVRRFRAMPASFATVEQTAGSLAWTATLDLAPTFWGELEDRYGAVTPADIRRVAQATVGADHMKIVVAGDASVLKPQLLALGWGPVEIHDATGALVRVESATP